MKIDKLIKIFEKMLPLYEKAYKEDWKKELLIGANIDLGLCYSARQRYNVYIYPVFNYNDDGHYKNYVTDGYLSKRPNTGKDLHSRVLFLKKNIPYLKSLIEKGYTHI